MKKALAALAAVAVAVLAVSGMPAHVLADEQTSNVTVENHSDWEMHHFYVSPTKQDKWGPDQLGEETISKGKSFKLTGIPCGTYDAKLVDEDGDACVITGAKLCGAEYTWKITNDLVQSCAAAGGTEE
jgi:hypothetical protein